MHSIAHNNSLKHRKVHTDTYRTLNGNEPWTTVRGYVVWVIVRPLTGADGDGDGRCVVAGDFRNNGQLDLVLRQSGGGPVLLYENRFPRRHYLEVSLRGHQSNRLGIGARLTAVVRGQSLVRELYPLNSFTSQMPSRVHFGLGEATQVESLTIRWPSGREQHLTNVAGDRHIVVDEAQEGEAAVTTVAPGQTIAP